MNMLSAGTVRTLLIASASGTNVSSGGWNETIVPSRPACSARTAPAP